MPDNLYSWGQGNNGQLGDSTNVAKASPVLVGALTDWSFVASSPNSNHSLARKTDGTLWAWGQGATGGLGQITSIANQSSPVQVGTLSGWSNIATGTQHSIASKTDGTLWAWGLGTSGQIGEVSVALSRSSPVQIGTLTNWSTPVSGPNFTLSTKTDGTLWAWGTGSSGVLGQVTNNTNRSSPVQIGTLTSWSSISAGNSHILARKTDNTLWAWGNNSNGPLGQVTNNTNRSSPVQVGTLTTWSSAGAGISHSLATQSDGTLWAWGTGTGAELGDGSRISRSSPVQIGTLTNWAGVIAGVSHSLARKTDGTLWAWGTGSSGQLGNGEDGSRISPVQIGTLTNWADTSAGGSTTNATEFGTYRKTDGTLWAWGQDTNGYLGQVTTSGVNRSSPTQIGTLTSWSAISTAGLHALATRTDGTLWAWGNNGNGPLGQVTNNTTRSSPVQIGTLTNWANTISAGKAGDHSLATRTDGTLWAWGNGGSGQLGLVTAATNRSSPVQIGTLTNWASIQGGISNSLARKTDGTLWAWGNDTGVLGQVTVQVSRSSPVQIGTLTSWDSYSIGGGHALATRTDGTLWAWGTGSSGQLGLETTNVARSSPVQIGTLTSWSVVHAGNNTSSARKTDGTLWAWGGSASGEVPDGTRLSRSSPVQIGTLTGWSSFSLGGNFGASTRTDGTLWTWGNGTVGQLGNNEDGVRESPIQIGSLTAWEGIAAGGTFSFGLLFAVVQALTNELLKQNNKGKGSGTPMGPGIF